MSTQSKPEDTKKDPGQDTATFERLSEKTKELMKLKDQLEETTGPEEIAISREIHHKARKSHPD